MAANISGIVINEILADPNTSGGGFDTDEDGTAEARDEFVELFNSSGVAVDIGGWTLNDGESSTFTFPTGTIVQPSGHVTVVGSYTGPIPAGFFAGLPPLNNSGDEIILSNGTETIAAIYNNADLTDIPDGVTPDNFGSDSEGQSIARSPDGSDTFLVGAPAPECFLTGTLIATVEGDRAVETLKIGDRMQTLDGTSEPIKWIGRQTLSREKFHPFRAYPVEIKAGALGDNLPVRNLYVSPDHALLVDNVLVNAGALINGMSIIQIVPETETFDYYHIELERHALMLAEGTPAESFIPQNVEGRDKFHNVEQFAALYPEDDALAYRPMSFPRVSSQRQLPAFMTKRLKEIAGSLSKQLAEATA